MSFLQKTLFNLVPFFVVSLSNTAMASDDVLFDKIVSLQQKTNVADTLLKKAKTFIGTPYRFGGNTPSGFDCSGFMQYVFKNVGVSLPRNSRDMATVGNHVRRDALQIGDMVFFAHNGTTISHVGMYVGEDRFIHAPSSGKSVEITNLNSNYWKSRYITARRVL